MNPDERERLVRVEDHVKFHREKLGAVEQQLGTLHGKVDQLIAASHMGKGAWWAATKISGVLVLLVSGIAWLWVQVK